MSELSKEMFCQANYERALLSYCFDSVENYYIIAAAIGSKDFFTFIIVYKLFRCFTQVQHPLGK